MAKPVRASVSILRVLLFPSVVLLGLVVMAVALQMGTPLALAPYAAVFLCALVVLWGERVIPYRTDWTPTGRELADDALFLSIVQVALPLALGWLAAYAAVTVAARFDATLSVWPSHWPLWAQVLLKIAAGDLLRYGLHRASHETRGLWRLHAVHHAPSKLYAVNVFRFHPADKALQFSLDTLPFVLLGASAEVFAWYFVVYAVAGLFQHSNCDVRLGPLNMLVVGPELHRWHHSRRVSESNANYAHTFALWDVLFGTWRMPRNARVDRLGLLDPDYPRSFLGQLVAPLKRSGSQP